MWSPSAQLCFWKSTWRRNCASVKCTGVVWAKYGRGRSVWVCWHRQILVCWWDGQCVRAKLQTLMLKFLYAWVFVIWHCTDMNLVHSSRCCTVHHWSHQSKEACHVCLLTQSVLLHRRKLFCLNLTRCLSASMLTNSVLCMCLTLWDWCNAIVVISVGNAVHVGSKSRLYEFFELDF